MFLIKHQIWQYTNLIASSSSSSFCQSVWLVDLFDITFMGMLRNFATLRIMKEGKKIRETFKFCLHFTSFWIYYNDDDDDDRDTNLL